VIHTANPTNGDAGEIYVELVRGLGEAIVSGTVPGAALTFVARKDDIENPKVGGWVGGQGNRGRGRGLCWQRAVWTFRARARGLLCRQRIGQRHRL
jgi:hypothetical protein